MEGTVLNPTQPNLDSVFLTDIIKITVNLSFVKQTVGFVHFLFIFFLTRTLPLKKQNQNGRKKRINISEMEFSTILPTFSTSTLTGC